MLNNMHTITRPTWLENTAVWAKIIGLSFISIIAIFLAVVIGIGIYNYINMPPIGTRHTLKENRIGHAVVVYGAQPKIGYVEKSWAAVCMQAQGGTMTLTEHLFFRKDVKLFAQLTGTFATGTYVYMPPKNYPSGPTTLQRWCPEGFAEAMPYNVYPADGS